MKIEICFTVCPRKKEKAKPLQKENFFVDTFSPYSSHFVATFYSKF